ncbi:MAG: hypothetical protein CL674_03305 [Bdellovibrionaceae bacterium]|nr:hypothetical protein [Pseudobdellovibrionaceae bacterium]|tara:strand:- start:10408 stop:19161 length:8754 start_codon:yes stop_codon:yes gene_type:complete
MRKLLKILSLIILSACIGTPSDEQSSIAKFKKIEIQFEEISLSEGENKLFNIELSQNTVEDLVLEWKILGPNVNSRFQFTEGTVSIQKNTKSVPVQLKSLDDGVFNPNLEYEIVLENLSEVRQQIETSGRSFVLIDNDPKPEISFSSTSNDGLEHIGSVPVYISLDKASAKTLQVRYTVKDSSTASASDYVISGSFEVPAFSTSSFFNFSIVDDVILEAPETVLLEIEEVLYDDIQLFISPTDNVHSFTIYDNESTVIDPPSSIQLSDVSANPGYARGQNVQVAIDEDVTTVKWCLSELQTSMPADGNAICLGGTGPDNGWYLTEPTSFTLSPGDGIKNVYIWTANYVDDVNDTAVSASISLDETAPSVIVTQDSGQADPASSLNIEFDATFSEEISFSDLSNSDIQFSGSVFAPTAVISSADNTLVNVSIDSLHGNGTLSVAIPEGVVRDLAGNPNLASVSGADNQVTVNIAQGKSIYRSVGHNQTTAIALGADSGGIDMSISSSIASFSEGLASKVGIGDAIVYDSDDDSVLDSIAFVAQRTTDRHFLLQTESGASVPSFSLADQDWQVFRSYTSLQNAENAVVNSNIPIAFDTWSGGRDLIANSETWHLVLYADNVFSLNSAVEFDSWVTGGFNYLKIYSVEDLRQVGESQRSIGLWDENKVVLRSSKGVFNLKEDFVEITGLQLEGDLSSGDKSLVQLEPSSLSKIILQKNLFKISNDSIGVDHAAILVETGGETNRLVIANNLFYDFSISSAVGVIGGSGKTYVYNNSFANVVTAIKLSTDSADVTAINNLVYNTSGPAFDTSNGANFNILSDYNISDDASGTGGANDLLNTSLNLMNPPSDDFRISLADASLVNHAKDLQADEVFPISSALNTLNRTSLEAGALAANLTDFTWTGASGDALYSTDGNWYGGSAPSATDDVYFNYICGANCSVTLDQVSLGESLEMDLDFSGTLTQQDSSSVVLGKTGLILRNGNFVGGSSSASLSLGSFKQFGGVFSAPDSSLSLVGSFANDNIDSYFMRRAGSFTHSSGYFKFGAQAAGDCDESVVQRLVTSVPTEFNDMVIDIYDNDCHGSDDAVFEFDQYHSKLLVHGNLQIDDGKIYWGLIDLEGDLNLSCADGADVYGECLSLNNTLRVRMMNSSIKQYYHGSGPSPSLIIDNPNGVAPGGGVTNYRVASLFIEQGEFLAPTGVLTLGRQSLERGTWSAGVSRSDFRIYGGSFNHNNAKVLLQPYHSDCDDYRSSGSGYYSSYTGSIEFNDLEIDITNGLENDICNNEDDIRVEILSATEFNVAGDLVMKDGRLLGGQINVAGDLSFECADGSDAQGSCVGEGTTIFQMNGSSKQNLSVQAGAIVPGAKLILNNPSSVDLTGAVNLLGSGQDLEVLQGTVNLAGDLTIPDDLRLESGSELVSYCNAITYNSLSGESATSAADGLNPIQRINGGEGAPVISVADTSATEDSNLEFSITLSEFSCTGDIDIDLDTANGTALTYDKDYTRISSGTLTIPAGQRSATVTVTVNDDTFWEADETMILNLSNPSIGSLASSSATGTILDNDSAAATHVWTGAVGDGLWSSSGNWLAGTLPSASDIVYFEGSSCSNCDANIDMSIDVKGIRSFSNYTGNLTQLSGNTISTGAANFYWQGGNFVGGDSNISNSESVVIEGGSFTNSSGIFYVHENLRMLSGTRDFSNGTIVVTVNGHHSYIETNGTEINNLEINATSYDLYHDGDITIKGALTLNMGQTNSNFATLNNEKIYLHGDLAANDMDGNWGTNATQNLYIAGTGTQNLNFSSNAILQHMYIESTGTVNLSGDFMIEGNLSYVSGTVNNSLSSFNLVGNRTSNISTGNLVWPNLTVNKSNQHVDIDGVLYIAGDFLSSSTPAKGGIVNGVLDVKGNVTKTTTGYHGKGLIRLTGSGTQEVSTPAGKFGSFEIASTGTVNLNNVVRFGRDLKHTSGTITYNSTTMEFNSYGSQQTSIIDYQLQAAPDVTFAIFSAEIASITGILDVDGTLSNIQPGKIQGGGTILASGDVNWNSGSKGENFELELDGSGTQVVSGVSTAFMGSLKVNSTGNVRFEGDILLNQHFEYVQGTIENNANFIFDPDTAYTFGVNTINITGNNFPFGNLTIHGRSGNYQILSPVDVSSTFELASLVGSTTLDGSQINLAGDLVITNGQAGGTTQIILDGTGDQSISYVTGRVPGSSLVINKASGQVNLASDLNLTDSGQGLDIQAGTLRMAGYDLNIANVLNLEASTNLYQDCGNISYGSLTGSGNLYGEASSPNISISDLSIEEGESGDVIVSLDLPNCSSSLSLDYQVNEQTATSIDQDYSVSSTQATLVFAPGEYQKSINVVSIEDDIMEDDETLTIDLSNNSLGNIADSQALVVITNDDVSSFIWTGLNGDGNWSTAGNWQGLSVPGSSDVAYFDSACTNCDVTIDSSIDVYGIRTSADYSGTITQNALMSIGKGDFLLKSGNFVGATQSISVAGHLSVGSGNFSSTSGELILGSINTTDILDGLELGSGNFIHNNGKVSFVGRRDAACGGSTLAGRIFSSSKNIEFYDLKVSVKDERFSGCGSSSYNQAYLELPANYDIIVNNAYIQEDGFIEGGNIYPKASVEFSCSDSHYISTKVCSGGGTSIMHLAHGGALDLLVEPGAALPRIVISNATDVGFNGISTEDLYIRGIDIQSGSFTGHDGSLEIGGVASSTDRSYLRVASASVFNAPSSTTLHSNASIGCSDSIIFDLDFDTNIQFKNLVVNALDSSATCGGGRNQAILEITNAGVVEVLGDFELYDGKLNSGEVQVQGNLKFTCPDGSPYSDVVCAGGGTSELKLTGSSSQSIQQDLGAIIPGANFYLSNSADLQLASDLNFNSANLFMQSGDMYLNDFNLSGVNDISEYSSNIIRNSSETVDYVSCLGGPVGLPCP